MRKSNPSRRTSVASLTLAALTVAPMSPTANADDYQFFQSPSGNISCQLGIFEDNGSRRGTASCQIAQHTFHTPPRPPDCQGAWGDSIGLIQGKPASLQCHTDTLLGSAQPVLDYGQSRARGHIVCTSLQDSMRCADEATDHGFLLSRDDYRLN